MQEVSQKEKHSGRGVKKQVGIQKNAGSVTKRSMQEEG
jgi:hypothetical protein